MTLKVVYKKGEEKKILDLPQEVLSRIRENDMSTWPVIPTLLKSGDVEGFTWVDEGYYGVYVNPKGIECLSPHAVKYDLFDMCKAACDIHNQFAGLSVIETATLYAQRRFTKLKEE